MSLKITCPKSDKHRTFNVTAHVAQEWKVDENGNFLSMIESCTDVIHRPEQADLFACSVCGADAKVERI